MAHVCCASLCAIPCEQSYCFSHAWLATGQIAASLTFDGLIHPVPLNLYDPFGFNDSKSREELGKSLLVAINKCGLAQIGIFGMLSTVKGLIFPCFVSIEGIKSYDGEMMMPVTDGDTSLPCVDELFKIKDQLAFPLAGA